MNERICRLNSTSSHQLEAEQVIPDLPSALKELIENSLDSNPDSIGIQKIQRFILKHCIVVITLFNYGMDQIIIEDTGLGITGEDMSEIGNMYYFYCCSTYHEYF